MLIGFTIYSQILSGAGAGVRGTGRVAIDPGRSSKVGLGVDRPSSRFLLGRGQDADCHVFICVGGDCMEE